MYDTPEVDFVVYNKLLCTYALPIHTLYSWRRLYEAENGAYVYENITASLYQG